MNKKEMFKTSKGITLIALVITIIILIILAGVSINVTIGEEGIITRAKEAKENMEIAINEENERLAELKEKLDTNIEVTKNNKANAPVLLTGMTPIKFTMPTEETKGTTVETTKTDKDWYEYGTTYETRRWANAVTKNSDNQITGYWVWIPRYAYKIAYTDPSDKAKGGVIDVVFLIGTTDNYYDEEGRLKTAQRQKTADETIDTTADFTVHPAFTNESNINFANGGWDKELTGIWVAKFEAGYAQGNNDVEVVASNVNYSQATAYVRGIERGTDANGNILGNNYGTARNWLDGIYGETLTSVKYPVFIPLAYSMHYINHGDTYKIARLLTDSNNIYGLVNTNADSHLMKNSEWGACVYLTQSIYGQNGTEITTNNSSLNSGNRQRTETSGKSGVDSVYAVTGCTSNTTNTGENITSIDEINSVTGNNPTSKTDELLGGIYTWNQLTGQNASSTGTIYGIYDLSGYAYERTASYIANANDNLKVYGDLIAYENNVLKSESTKYTTVYPYTLPESTTLDTASQNNFKENTKTYGDVVRETTGDTAGTTNNGWNISAWNEDTSCFPGYWAAFFSVGRGLFAFNRHAGISDSTTGFRAVLVPVN